MLLWAFSSGYPTLRKSVVKPVYGEATLTEAAKSAKVPISTGTGPFNLTVTGKLKSSGNQVAEAGYEITATGSEGGSDTVEGSLEYQVHQTRSRKGSSQWSESNDEISHRLSSQVRGKEVTVTVDHVDDLFENGLHVSLGPRSIDPWIFWGIGIAVVMLMMWMEATVGDAKDKTHLVMTSLGTLAFAMRFYQKATAHNLVRPAVDALFVALLVGGLGRDLPRLGRPSHQRPRQARRPRKA